jgi:hypothetical protein
MDNSTLYYTLSTIPQILAATSAILAAFIHFRLSTIHNFLVGDGKSALNRLGETGYELEKKESDRLRDGVNRKSIAEIKEILEVLKEKEISDGFEKSIRPTGLQYLFEDRFCPTEKHYNKLQKYAIYVIGFSLFSIICSLVSLSQVDCIIVNNFQSYILIINTILLILSIIFSFILVIISFRKKTIYEDIKKRDFIINRNKENSKS